MGKQSGIRVKITVTVGFLITWCTVSFIAGGLIVGVVMSR